MSINKTTVNVTYDDPAIMRVSENAGVPGISPEQRLQMIAEAAYHLAESQGFQGNDPQADWLNAEIEISKI